MSWDYTKGPVIANSSWVEEYGFVENSQTGERGLTVVYKSGVICYYPGTTLDHFRNLDHAQSKGKWVHRNLLGRSYTVVE